MDGQGEVETQGVVKSFAAARVRVRFCVLLMPSSCSDDWLGALEEAAGKAGFQVILHESLTPPAVNRHEVTILVTSQVGVLDIIAADRFAVIATDLANASDTMASFLDQPGSVGMYYASRFLAICTQLPRAQTSIFGDSELRAGALSFEAFEGIAVRVPPGVRRAVLEQQFSEYQAACADALRLYDNESFVSEWRAPVFTLDANSGQAQRPEAVDLTGKPRIFVSGPYIHLTPGLWRVTAKFSIDSDAIDHRYRFEWGELESFTTFKETLRQQGLYEVTMEHGWTKIGFAEFRVALGESALAGEFTFLGAVVEKIS